MTYKKIAFPICIASAVLMLSACGGGGSSGTSGSLTGTFIDAPVENLRYECNPSNISNVTNVNGEFNCNSGDKVTFHLGAMEIGPVDVEADMIVTPYRLYPTNPTAAVRLSQLLLSLDDDGDVSERITIVEEFAQAITVDLDPTLYSFDAEAEALLDEVNVTLVDYTTAKGHLSAQDTGSPIVTLDGDATVTIYVGETYMDAGATAYDAFDGPLNPVKSGTVNTSVAGTYNIVYSATDQAGNRSSVTRTVTVVQDTIAPVVTLNGDATVTINVGDTYTDAGATAVDNVDGALTPVMAGSVNTAAAGSYTITWTATDAASNVGTATRTVFVVEQSGPDTIPPVVTLNGDATVTINVGDTYTDAGATAVDNVDGALAPVMAGSVNTAAAGSYTITWTATDAASNVGTATRTVTVEAAQCQNVNPLTGQCLDAPAADTIPPVVTLNGDATVTINVGDTYTDAGATAVDNVDGALASVMAGSVNTAAAGSYTITWTATDAASNVGTATRTVTVEAAQCQNVNPLTGQCLDAPAADTIPPVVTLNGDATVTITVGDSYTDAGATAVDNVDGALTPVMAGSVDTSTAGTDTITWTATDAASNVGTATRTVTVEAAQCQNVNPLTGQCLDI